MSVIPNARGGHSCRVLCALWLAALGVEALAYRLLEMSDAERVLGVVGVISGLVLFLGPFLLGAYTLVAMRKRLIESAGATLPVMVVGVAVVGLAAWAEPGGGSAIANVGFLLLLIAGLGPWFLGLFVLAWLLKRRARWPRPRNGESGFPELIQSRGWSRDRQREDQPTARVQ